MHHCGFHKFRIGSNAEKEVPVNPKHIRSTHKQRNNLAILKARLGEWGYFIYPMSKVSRRHSYDTVAIPKDKVQRSNVLLIRIRRHGLITIQPFQDAGNYYHFRQKLKNLQKKRVVLGVHWYSQRFQRARIYPYRWDAFLRPADRDALSLLNRPTDRRPDKKLGT